jgi:hypothetical protein
VHDDGFKDFLGLITGATIVADAMFTAIEIMAEIITFGVLGAQVADPRKARLLSLSFPEFPWSRLRKEFPEKYEGYVDLAPGQWTKIRIEVTGDRARLYVNGAGQPVLIVNDLKLSGQASGAIGLWIGPGTVAHFTNVAVSGR